MKKTFTMKPGQTLDEGIIMAAKKESYNYMDRTADLIELLANKQDKDEDIIQSLYDVKDHIHEIASHVRQIEMFKECIDRFNEYKSRFVSMTNRNEAIRDAWMQFVIKINSAPTQMHLRGVVILNIPVIDDLLTSSN